MCKDDFKTCVAGCKHFSGGEVKHHSSCPNYPESFSEMYDKLRIHNVSKQRELLIDFIEWYREDDISKFTPQHLADWYLKSN